MNHRLIHPAEQLVMIMDRIYRFGMTTTSGGNLSIMDDEGNIWITPSGIDKGTLRREDIMCVHPDGTVEGKHTPSMELPFHSALYRLRPDIKAVLHAHPPALVAFSAVRVIPDLTIVKGFEEWCGEIRMADYELPGSEKLGDNIRREFEKGGNTVIMENHGVVIGMEDIFSAYKRFETLDLCARIQLNALELGTAPKAAKNDDKNCCLEKQPGWPYTPKELDAIHTLCTFTKRAYQQGLFSSVQGTYSLRVNENEFVIFSHDADRYYAGEQDVLRVKDGIAEEGREPSRMLKLHQAIYDANPDVHSVVTAQPAAIMGFAVNGSPFDARLIPESYIMLKDVQRFENGTDFETITRNLCLKNPVGILENEAVVSLGTSAVNAYDRLEVLEYSAKAILSALKLGPIVRIPDEQVEEINVTFKLN